MIERLGWGGGGGGRALSDSGGRTCEEMAYRTREC